LGRRHKLALLAANAFGMPVDFAETQVEGITALQALDVACRRATSLRIKLLAVARRRDDGVELRVQPALLPATHLLAQVNGSMNGIMVKGDASGVTMYYGAGAGRSKPPRP
jgi:homoserine dehydrogenase